MVDQLLRDSLDMLVSARVDDARNPQTYRAGHMPSNCMLTSAVSGLFGCSFRDVLSGDRIFSQRSVKSFLSTAPGFEVETELAAHAQQMRMAYAEVQVRYLARLEETQSKLSTFRAGQHSLKAIARLFVSERPLTFFSSSPHSPHWHRGSSNGRFS